MIYKTKVLMICNSCGIDDIQCSALIFHRFYAIIHIGGDDMFLTKKSVRKILIMAICYFILGSIAIFLWFVFNNMGINENFLLILGIIVPNSQRILPLQDYVRQLGCLRAVAD